MRESFKYSCHSICCAYCCCWSRVSRIFFAFVFISSNAFCKKLTHCDDFRAIVFLSRHTNWGLSLDSSESARAFLLMNTGHILFQLFLLISLLLIVCRTRASDRARLRLSRYCVFINLNKTIEIDKCLFISLSCCCVFSPLRSVIIFLCIYFKTYHCALTLNKLN